MESGFCRVRRDSLLLAQVWIGIVSMIHLSHVFAAAFYTDMEADWLGTVYHPASMVSAMSGAYVMDIERTIQGSFSP